MTRKSSGHNNIVREVSKALEGAVATGAEGTQRAIRGISARVEGAGSTHSRASELARRAVDEDHFAEGPADRSSSSVPKRPPTPNLDRLPRLDRLLDRGLHDPDFDVESALKGLERQFGPYHVRDVSAMYVERYDDGYEQLQLELRGDIFDADGNPIGDFHRQYFRDADGRLVANHESFKLHEDYRGQGFSLAFSNSMENYYRRSGVDRIEICARDEDGGVAWARAGYDWDPDSTRYRISVENLTARIDDMISRTDEFSAADRAELAALKEGLAKPYSLAPSPTEIVTLQGADGKLGEKLMRGSTWYGMKKL
ncbi:hypothetical protein [Nocardia sienata]|uniref:hypothetical protein n=1 Tax=Nocardia sienata TaxID=248552 RepID=UPI0007A4CFC0|nr:hypothetical protein [Nocardia sienata]